MRAPSACCAIFVRLAVVFLVLAFAGPQAAFAKKPFEYYGVGDTTVDAEPPRPATPSLVLMGGTNVDAAFKWMIEKAGGGNFVVIRARKLDDYNAYIYDKIGGVTSVETIVIPSRAAAHDPAVIAYISRADALFIAGGDQSDYINYWQGTPVQAAIQELASKNVPIGGLSAGMAVMGEYAFAALNGPISSSDALANPFDKAVTLTSGLLALPSMAGLITETHFYDRNRMGRLVTFMARLVNDGWTTNGMVRGLALDEGAALVIDNGVASLKRAVPTAGSAYFLQTEGKPQMYPKIPLTYASVGVQRLSVDGGTFDLREWSSIYTYAYSVSAINGALHSTQAGDEPY